MRKMHTLRRVIDPLRAFFIILEEGSISRAATRLHLTQPSLSRQIQALEHELGAPMLERRSSGVVATAFGQAVVGALGPLVDQWDAALAELRRHARGQHAELRIGYLGSAGARFLDPALLGLRRVHPQAKVRLLDLTPGEQIGALRSGAIDLALIGQEGAGLAREFYTLKLATLGVCVALPADHRLAGRAAVAAAELREEVFIGAPEDEVPGRNRWIAKICRAAGFRPRMIAEPHSIGEAFSMVASEGAVTLLPAYFSQSPPPATRLVPLSDPSASWDLLLIWQRGRASQVLKTMVELMRETARANHPQG